MYVVCRNWIEFVRYQIIWQHQAVKDVAAYFLCPLGECHEIHCKGQCGAPNRPSVKGQNCLYVTLFQPKVGVLSRSALQSSPNMNCVLSFTGASASTYDKVCTLNSDEPFAP